MNTSIKCRSGTRMVFISARYTAARCESIYNYRAEPSRDVSASQNCVETATHFPSNTHKFAMRYWTGTCHLRTGAASPRNSQSKNMGCNGPFDGGNTDERTEYLSGGAELLPKVWGNWNGKFSRPAASVLLWLKLISETCNSYLFQIKSCENNTTERARENVWALMWFELIYKVQL